MGVVVVGGEGSSLFWSRLLINNNNKHTTVQHTTGSTAWQRLRTSALRAFVGSLRVVQQAVKHGRDVSTPVLRRCQRWLLHLGPAAMSSIGRRD